MQLLGACAKDDEPLSREMRTALEAVAPKFQLYRRDHFASAIRTKNGSDPYGLSLVRGDFNGDGRLDAAVLGHANNNEYLAAIISTPDRKYAARLIEPARPLASANPEAFLQLEAPGVIDIPDSAGEGLVKFHLVHDGIELLFDDSAGILYYWDHGAFRKVISGD